VDDYSLEIHFQSPSKHETMSTKKPAPVDVICKEEFEIVHSVLKRLAKQHGCDIAQLFIHAEFESLLIDKRSGWRDGDIRSLDCIDLDELA
jgi:hypothetical protein